MNSPLKVLACLPVRYSSSLEQLSEDEAETQAGLIETIGKIQHKVQQDSGQAMRGVHAKSHGLLVGEMQVLSALPEVLAQGLFSKAASYPVVMRYSTIPGDVLDDSISVPRGLAIKVVGVSGARAPGSESDVTQDFVLADGPAFAKATPKGFLSTLKLLAATTDKAPGLKKALSSVMRGAEKLVESVGAESATLMTLGGYPHVHPLGDSYFSQAPILYGDYMAKISVQPSSAALRALTKAPLDLSSPNAMREAIAAFFSSNAAEWDLLVQLCTDLHTMPIEDASVPWPEDKSPYIAVARLAVSPQETWNEHRAKAIDQGMSFSPWHALAAHRPLGAINRVRKAVYASAMRFRSEHSTTPVIEPRTQEDLPS